MAILEQTLAEWSAWFVENRASEFEVYSASPVEIIPETVLLRIFAPPDGRVPKHGYHLKGQLGIFQSKNRKITSFYSVGKATLL